MTELAKQYDPATVEHAVTSRWLETKAFAATPDERDNRYVIMMPLPNVTGALHMGHAMDNVMQDMLTRWHRMAGDNTLWMAGTDHAGIATQSVVEKRIFELEGKNRHDIGRDELVRRIWEWKDQYQARIVTQQQGMGCGCDWDRQRFTMDDMCARAVRHTFFRMFKEGLIYQGDRLVNWDCHLQTAVADDELYKKTVNGHFWHLRYPVLDPKAGEPTHIIVATTRPETMLGDTAVACHGEPRKTLESHIRKTEERLANAAAKDKADIEIELKGLRERMETVIPDLETIAAMARDGRKIMLPLMDREIPLICDEWAKPELGSGCVKITPAHDPNDYDVWRRHQKEIEVINVLSPDGTMGPKAGMYAGLDRFKARKQVVADFEAKDLLEKIEDRVIEIDHSDRSKTIIEPYLSKQWFVKMDDVDGGIVCGPGTKNEFKSPGLAQAAIDAADGEWETKTGRKVSFHPDQDRYHKIFHSWLVEKRDWCISRQLWWGHRIPVWSGTFERDKLLNVSGMLPQGDRADIAAWAVLLDDKGEDTRRVSVAEAIELAKADHPETAKMRVLVSFLDPASESQIAPMLGAFGLKADPDVLDTWFSSALWPHSTLGWPNASNAPINDGQSPTAAEGDRPDTLDYYFPGSCLVTGRDIISLWVARMVVMGLYNLGDVPFTDVFLHANILDGKGDRMSKSKGNGVDPMDMIEQYGADAMRYVMCEMQTGTQDIRLPVQAKSPFVEGEVIDMTKAKASRHQGCFIDPNTKKEFDMVGLMADQGVPSAKALCERMEVGRNFCNKLWNAARFAFMNLEGTSFETRELKDLEVEDRWILSRLSHATDTVQKGLETYNPSMALNAARDFFWNELCDWYLELIKPRMRDEAAAPVARQVLAACLDQILRLLQPFVPFITEELFEKLGEIVPERGITEPLPKAAQLVHAAWPVADHSWRDEATDAQITFMQDVVTAVREARARYQVPPSKKVPVQIKAQGDSADRLNAVHALMGHITNAETLEISADITQPKGSAVAVVHDIEAFVLGVIDPEKERAKLEKQKAKLIGQITGIEKKLSNEKFVSKAPPAVVEKEKKALDDLRTQLASIEQSLDSL